MVKVFLLYLAAVAAVLIQTEAKDSLKTNIKWMDGIAEDQTQARFLNLVVNNIVAMDSQWSHDEKYSPKVVFDIGCGSGDVMEHVIKRVRPELTQNTIFHGIDHSPTVIKMAQQQFTEVTYHDPVKRLFSVGSMHDLWHVEDNSVDFMYSNLVFQHSPDINDLFKHLSSKLQNGCKLTFATISMEIKDHPLKDKSHEYPLQDKSQKYPRGRLSNKWNPIELSDVVNSNYDYTLTEWTSALENAGFFCKVIRNVENNGIIGDAYKNNMEVRDIIIDAVYVG